MWVQTQNHCCKRKSCRPNIMLYIRRADSQVPSISDSPVSVWTREIINIQREKRGVTTSLVVN